MALVVSALNKKGLKDQEREQIHRWLAARLKTE